MLRTRVRSSSSSEEARMMVSRCPQRRSKGGGGARETGGDLRDGGVRVGPGEDAGAAQHVELLAQTDGRRGWTAAETEPKNSNEP
jgi:hypothetical protein